MCYTEGKWKVSGPYPKLFAYADGENWTQFYSMTILAENGIEVAIIDMDTQCNNAEAAANARLIATAPDLLEACKGLIEDKEILEQDDGITACQCIAKITEPSPCIYCIAKAAIDKAKGDNQ